MERKRWEDYALVKLPSGTITFGTSLFIRDDGKALRIVFPTGQVMTFEPMSAEKDEDTAE